jgi:hypothetical protein
MAARPVRVMIGGSADWGQPVRYDGTTLKTWYEAYLMGRFEIGDGDMHYLKLRIVGIDEIDNEGEVPAGWGSLEFQDRDGDYLRGHTDWFRKDDVDYGTWTISSGTGKWEDAKGKIELVLYGMPQDLEMEQPPRTASRYFGWLEGEGTLELQD